MTVFQIAELKAGDKCGYIGSSANTSYVGTVAGVQANGCVVVAFENDNGSWTRRFTKDGRQVGDKFGARLATADAVEAFIERASKASNLAFRCNRWSERLALIASSARAAKSVPEPMTAEEKAELLELVGML